MAYSAKIGSFNIDTAKTAGQTQAVTGVGFTPKIVLFWWSGTTDTGDGARGEDISFGFGAMSGASSRWRVVGYADDANGTSTSGRYSSDANCITTYLNGATLDGQADFGSLDADGFTLTIDTQFTVALRVSYLALGGTDLTNVYLGNVAQPNATGNYSETGVGFQPDALITADVVKTSASGGASLYLALGMATGASNQGVIGLTDRNAQATTVTCSYGYNGEVIGCMGYDSVAGRDTFVSFDEDGFTLNELEASGAANLIFYIALKGGQYSVGDITTRTDGNDIAEVVGFTPVALLFMSANQALSTQDTTSPHLSLSIGGATSAANRAAQAVWDEDNLADSETATANYDTACYANVKDDGVVGLMDIKSIDVNGFTAVMDDTDPAGCWVTYLAIGAAGGGGGISKPRAMYYYRQRRK